METHRFEAFASTSAVFSKSLKILIGQSIHHLIGKKPGGSSVDD